MALTANSPILAAELIALKAKIKAEVLRRNQSGSVAAYGGTAYDYVSGTDTPVAGQVIKPDAYNKIVTPTLAINNVGSHATIATGGVIRALGDVNTKVTAWATRALTDTSATDCKSGCTGTCYTGCSTGCYSGCTSCSGCGSTCSGGCLGCGSTCGGGCTSCTGCLGCSAACTDTCDMGCQGTCRWACTVGCADSCTDATYPGV